MAAESARLLGFGVALNEKLEDTRGALDESMKSLSKCYSRQPEQFCFPKLRREIFSEGRCYGELMHPDVLSVVRAVFSVADFLLISADMNVKAFPPHLLSVRQQALSSVERLKIPFYNLLRRLENINVRLAKLETNLEYDVRVVYPANLVNIEDESANLTRVASSGREHLIDNIVKTEADGNINAQPTTSHRASDIRAPKPAKKKVFASVRSIISHARSAASPSPPAGSAESQQRRESSSDLMAAQTEASTFQQTTTVLAPAVYRQQPAPITPISVTTASSAGFGMEEKTISIVPQRSHWPSYYQGRYSFNR
jgi:hypothetical protein